MKKIYVLPGAIILVLMMLTACAPAEAGTPSVPAGTPTLRAFQEQVDTEVKYSTEQISADATVLSTTLIESRQKTNAWTIAIAIGLLILAVGAWFVPWQFYVGVVVVAVLAGAWGRNTNLAKIPELQGAIVGPVTSSALENGVDFATNTQATSYQTIHAKIVSAGHDVVPCDPRHENSGEFCVANAHYYSTESVDCVPIKNSDGQKIGESCDTEYTNWFQYLTKYWIVVDTQARLLDEKVYGAFGLRCYGGDNEKIEDCHRDEFGKIDDKRRPVVYLHADWRAPENSEQYKTVIGGRAVNVGAYNNHVPQDWFETRRHAENCQRGDCGTGIVATFAGSYYNWGFAADSPLFEPDTGSLQRLMNFASLPEPNGHTFNIRDDFGNPVALKTDLYSPDGELPLHFDPVKIVGTCISPSEIAPYQSAALELQGHFGPNKQGSLRWYIVCDDVVLRMEGIGFVVDALKAYQKYTPVQGYFGMPKNLALVVTSVNAFDRLITGRGFETGMATGNEQLIADMSASLTTPLPLTPENMIGAARGNYTGAQVGEIRYGEKSYARTYNLQYAYNDLSVAGGAASILYMPDPTYVPVDPADPSCTINPAPHHGWVRFRMCNVEYLKTDVKLNQDGYNHVMGLVRSDIGQKVPVWPGWLFLVFSVIALFVSFGNRLTRYESPKQRSRRGSIYR